MTKKAQISIYIILGIILLAIIGLLLYIRAPKEEAGILIEVPTELQPLKNYIDECIKDVTIPGIHLLGVQGGYIYLPDDILAAGYSNVSYGYYERKDTLISVPEMELQLSNYVSSSLPLCTDFSIFKEFDITTEEIETETTITGNSVIIKVNYPIKAKKEGYEGDLKEFRQEIPIRLGHIYNVLKDVIGKTMQDPDWIDLTYLSEFDVDISVMPHDEENLVYSITDNSSLEPYIFLSAFKYKVNKAPVLELPDSFTLEDGVPFLYQVAATDAENDILVFSDDTAMFDITEDGVILFTPEVPGSYDVTITAEDNHGNYDEKVVEFIVR